VRKCLSIVICIAVCVFSCKPLKLNKVGLVTSDTVIVANNVVTAYGTIIDIGEADKIFDYGFMLNDSLFNTTTISKGSLSTPDSFKHIFSRLSPDQEYIVVSYSDDASNVIYGDTLRFSLSSDEVAVHLSSYLAVDSKTANCDASVENVGSLYLKELGICYSLDSLPQMTDRQAHIWNVQNDTSKTFEIGNLKTDEEYFYRAFAVFGNDSVKYSDSIISATITSLKVNTDTHSITISTDTTVTMEGEIIDMGANPVIDHGFCWSYTTNTPSYNDNVIVNGIATSEGKYYSVLQSPLPYVTYYYRAYATDGESVKYGEVKAFILE
jgi:hypothetical protein